MKKNEKSNQDSAPTEQELKAQLSPCPRAGQGVHPYLFREACKLWRLGGDDDTIVRLLREAVSDCGREVGDEEIESAVYNAEEVERRPDGKKRPWPKPNQRLIRHVINSCPGALEKLKAISPVIPLGMVPLDFINQLFPDNPLLCFAPEPKFSLTKPLDVWGGEDGADRLMVPSAMSAPFGINKKGRKSSRCLANTGPRKYLVVEFDTGTQEEQAALILHLSEKAPIVQTLFSGGKSLHAWFRCAGQKDEDLREFMDYAVSLGADRATWCRCQLVRTPAARRPNGNEQTVLFFNPSGAKVAGTQLADKWHFEELKASETNLFGLELYFDPKTQQYLFPTEYGWIPLSKDNLRMQLTELGYRAKYDKDRDKLTGLSPVQQIMAEVQRSRHIAYYGALAGYCKGLYHFNGQPVLVTESPKFVEPQPGDFTILRQFLENLFVYGGINQLLYVFAWLKIALEALRAGNRRPGQALVLAGPAGAGKSLFQDIVTELLGGRAAKPYRYMSGQTPFNAEQFGCEHQQIEDEVSSFSMTKRVEFGTRIKEMTVNLSQSCHAKGRQAILLTPFWRLTISANDEAEHLQILPPLDDSIADKLMLLLVAQKPMPMPTETPEQRKAYRDKLSAQLPALVYFLDHWQIPDGLRDERYGVKTFHHPELLKSINNLSPEEHLLDYLRIVVPQIATEGLPLVVTAAELTDHLTRICPATRTFLAWTGATGAYLGRLAKKYPKLIKQRRTSDKREWEISIDPEGTLCKTPTLSFVSNPHIANVPSTVTSK